MKKLSTLLLLFATIAFLASCKKDNNDKPADPKAEEEEVITTLNMKLTSGNETPIFSFKDLDGDGGNAPVITVDSLSANTTYDFSIELLNESESPAENITEEIQEEDEEHQFFFSSNLTSVTTTYGDKDDDGNPIGLTGQLKTGDAGSGTFTVTLRHEPNKSAANVSSGDITNAGGETDIEVTFDLNIQ